MAEEEDSSAKQQSPAPEVATPVQNDISDDEVDESLDESFPASDPPSWTLGTDHHVTSDQPDEKNRNELVSRYC